MSRRSLRQTEFESLLEAGLDFLVTCDEVFAHLDARSLEDLESIATNGAALVRQLKAFGDFLPDSRVDAIDKALHQLRAEIQSRLA